MLGLNDPIGWNRLGFEPDTGWWTFDNVYSKWMQLPTTATLHRRRVPLFPSGFFFGSAVGGDGSSKSLVRHDDVGDGVPLLDTWEKGDVVWNRAPAVGQPIGWVCLAAGTNGTMRGIKVADNVINGADRVPLNDTSGLAKWQYVFFTRGDGTRVDGVYQLVEDNIHPLVPSTVKINPPSHRP